MTQAQLNNNATIAQRFENIQIDPVEAYTKGFTDFHFFSALALPHVVDFPFPPLYIAIWEMLVRARTKEDRLRVLRFALGLPRGFAKTTFVKILLTWFFAYDIARFILVICADEPLAYNLIADIDGILSSRNMEAVYGKWAVNKAIDNREQKTCMYRTIPRILQGAGANSSTRGLNVLNERPDIILFDDMQTMENAKSDTESAALMDKFVGTHLKLVDPAGALIIYIGNMYAGGCILKELQASPQWVSLVTGCILENGESLWPELHPIDALYDSFKNDASLGRAHIWFAEMMNQPIDNQTSLLPNGLLPECLYTDEFIKENKIAGFVTVDPAGFKRLSDDNVIATHVIMPNYTPILVESDGGIYDPELVIEKAIIQCVTWNLSVIGIEGVGYQHSLLFWANKYIREHPEFNYINIVELTPAGRHKETRIITWIQEILASTYQVAGDARYNILFQALAYKIGKKNNKDDHLDAGAYGLDMKSNYWGVILSTQERAVDDGARVIENNTPF
jgi:hypothetical protein